MTVQRTMCVLCLGQRDPSVNEAEMHWLKFHEEKGITKCRWQRIHNEPEQLDRFLDPDNDG
jgi:hypothetical protein